MPEINEKVRNRLFEYSEKDFGDFFASLVPTLPRESIIGVRTPVLRLLAKEFAKEPGIEEFLNTLPHEYYEENCIHAFILEGMKDEDKLLSALDRFLPYVDNWSTCDLLSPPVFKKHRDKLLIKIREWLQSPYPYEVRFAIKMLMAHFLDADFKPEYLSLVSSLQSEEYYINMMRAWYFATALAKQYDAVLPLLEAKALDTFTHNKSIQKAIESRRITAEQKAYLRTLKVK